jgi:DNA repair exonuclease SbcCD ATPase subunit
MIVFHKLKFKNFLSTGNVFTEIDFTINKTNLVVGHNGAGKSTMLDALSFALFGKAHRNINKAQMVNSINKKGCVVQVEFRVHGSDFKVIRGIKPNTFEIWRDGVMINQNSHSKEYQKILEQNIIKLNHKSFHQIVVLGSSSFIPFMQLNSNHRREVIEDLLDIGMFSKMNALLKERQSLLRDKIKEAEHQQAILENNIDAAKENISQILQISAQQKQNKLDSIDEYTKQIDDLEILNNELQQQIESFDGLDSDQSSQSNLMSGYNKYKAKFEHEISDLNKQIKFYTDNDNCPTCEQEIAASIKDLKVSQANTRQITLQEALTDLDAGILAAQAELDAISDTQNRISQIQTSISNNQSSISVFNSNITKAIQEIQNIGSGADDLTSANERLSSLKEEMKEISKERLTMQGQASYNIIIAEMLKDTGIKTKIIKQYLPVINNLVNQYLQVLDFFVSFNLDEAFQETIRSRHRDDFTYDSFSEGEKQRIDLALLFTWRMVAKMKNSVATNLLILDETFDSSLDDDGVDNLMKILYTLEDDTNVFVISHKGELLDGKFDRKIEFVKKKNFSTMK